MECPLPPIDLNRSVHIVSISKAIVVSTFFCKRKALLSRAGLQAHALEPAIHKTTNILGANRIC